MNFNPILFYNYGQSSKAFISTWKTDNISTGSSASNKIKLPLISTGSYNMVVDWGDNSTSTITAYNQAQVTHTYSSAGTYQISIKGTCTGWQFSNNGDKLKILSVQNWGSLKLGTNQGAYFYGCANLNLSSVADVLNLKGTTELSYAFALCTSLTTINNISSWDVSNVIQFGGHATANTSGMFNGCISFNQNLNSWSVNKATSIAGMFAGATNFNNGSASGVLSPMTWNINTTSNVSMYQTFFNASAFNQDLSSWNVSKVSYFLRTFANTQFNSNIDNWNISNCIDFGSMFSGTPFNNGLASGVSGTLNLIRSGSVSSTMASMFSSCTSFNQNISSLNTSNVTTMNSMFSGCTNFNNGGYALTFDTSSVTTMASMFLNCSKFNNGLASGVAGTMTLNTSLVINTSDMFSAAIAFNQDIGSWNTSSVADMSGMFINTKVFNNGGSSSIGGWDTSNVIDMSLMFQSNGTGVAFNQNIGAWNVSKVANFSSMFRSAQVFNNGGSPDISNWVINTTSDVNMSSMFFGANLFNQPLNGWNTSRVINLSGMFQANLTFNNGLASGVSGVLAWNTSKVTNITSFINGGNAFNQDISSWDVGNVTSMNSALYGLKFNQNIGGWNISNVTSFNSTFIQGASLSTTNLDAIYNGWSTRPIKPNLIIGFGSAKRTAASTSAKAILTGAPNNWVITDGGI